MAVVVVVAVAVGWIAYKLYVHREKVATRIKHYCSLVVNRIKHYCSLAVNGIKNYCSLVVNGIKTIAVWL